MMAGMILCRRWSCWWRSVWAVVDLTWVLGMPFAASLSASHRALSFLVNTWIHLSPLLFWHQSIVEKKRPLSLLGLVTLWMGWSGYCKIHFKLALCTCKEIIVSEYFFFPSVKQLMKAFLSRKDDEWKTECDVAVISCMVCTYVSGHDGWSFVECKEFCLVQVVLVCMIHVRRSPLMLWPHWPIRWERTSPPLHR